MVHRDVGEAVGAVHDVVATVHLRQHTYILKSLIALAGQFPAN